MAVTYGMGNNNIAFGIPKGIENAKLSGFPIGAKVKVRARVDEFLQGFVTLPDGRSHWYYLLFADGEVSPAFGRGHNLKLTQQPSGLGTITRRRMIEDTNSPELHDCANA